jgi:tol-pal system-associated acyl-CoA thioesterase
MEDVDAQGIVYYANYLRFFERGRSEFLETLGVPMARAADPDCRLVIYEIRVKYRRPALLGDMIEVVTSVERPSDYRLTFHQRVRRRGETEPLVGGEVDIVAIGSDGAVRELPSFFDAI